MHIDGGAIKEAQWRAWGYLEYFLSFRTTALHVGEQPVGRSANVEEMERVPDVRARIEFAKRHLRLRPFHVRCGGDVLIPGCDTFLDGHPWVLFGTIAQKHPTARVGLNSRSDTSVNNTFHVRCGGVY